MPCLLAVHPATGQRYLGFAAIKNQCPNVYQACSVGLPWQWTLRHESSLHCFNSSVPMGLLFTLCFPSVSMLAGPLAFSRYFTRLLLRWQLDTVVWTACRSKTTHYFKSRELGAFRHTRVFTDIIRNALGRTWNFNFGATSRSEAQEAVNCPNKKLRV